ncbi:unnamed protein product [Rotaria magnacalcarata]|uniref:Uncharacterized protein n=1 Tax=Rotaria magnacalcarata TaxID=392030 RepID=A0A816U1P2_9BILA|nr:unnamed protein product [Rotaria magnacalcarata]
MLFSETESEFEFDVPETTSNPVLRPSLSVPFIGTHQQAWPPNSVRSLARESYQSSTEDLGLIAKFVSNFRISFHQSNILKQLKQRYSSNDNNNNNNQNTEQPQLICEERQENAIFKIFLKRLRQKPPTPIGSSSDFNRLLDDRDEQNELNKNDQSTLLYSTIKIYQLKAGTLEKIVECLTNKYGDLDRTHMLILFATYRTYTNTRILTDTILSRYQAVFPASLDMTEDVRQNTLKSLSMALIYLLTAYKEDFNEPPYYTTLNYLLQQITDRDVHNQCQSLLNQFLKEENTSKSTPTMFTLTHDIDNNNNSKNLLTDNVYNKKGLEYSIPKNLLEMSHVMIAEQLTIVDAELLKCVLPHECLTMRGNSKKQRGLNSMNVSSTVDKTIEQFNAVVNRVMATILTEPNELTRVRLIEKWIDIAYECRQLKNFSSLTAILNGLLSGSVYRLTQTWSQINIQHRTILIGLKNIFVSCANRKQARAILDKQLDEIRLTLPEDTEGTAKYVHVTAAMNATLSQKLRPKKSRNQKQMMIGTVPYLGLYLSDLTYIDSAHNNYININENDKSSQKLINFEKNRKQFEILAQIKLFQVAANAYTSLQPLVDFKHWFDNIQIFTDIESWDLSYRIEPKTMDNTDKKQKLQEDPSSNSRTRPLKAFPSELSLEVFMTPNNSVRESKPVFGGSLRSSPSWNSYDKISLTSNHSCPQRQPSICSLTKKKTHSRSSSASSFLTKDSSSQGYISAQTSPANSLANCTVNPVENDTFIAKVRLIGRDNLLYKKVRIGNNERASNVLKTILDKFCIDPTTHEDYCIEQKLPNRKLLLLDHYNVFYALARQSDDEQVELIVRKKARQEREQTKGYSYLNISHNRTPSGLSISSTHSR